MVDLKGTMPSGKQQGGLQPSRNLSQDISCAMIVMLVTIEVNAVNFNTAAVLIESVAVFAK